MDAISGVFINALNTDMTVMEEYFPFVVTVFSILQYTAWTLLFINAVWQLFRAFGGPIIEAENPWHLLVRSAFFAFLVAAAKPIFSIVLSIARAPYTALLDATMDPGDFTFAGIDQMLGSVLISILSVVTIVGLILQLILMITLGWNYFKLLLETVERYIVVGVLCYTSPLAFAMGGSKATSKVFQSWCRMVGSQLLLLILNVWFLRGFGSSVGHFIANAGALTTGQGNVFLWMFCAIAFLKTAQRFDSYLASIGLSVAQTGGGMGMEMLMGFRLLTGIAHTGTRTAGSMFGAAASGSASTASRAAGAGGFAPGLAAMFKGNTYVRDAVVDGGTRMGAGGGVGMVGRAFGGMAARNGTELTGASISSVASRPPSVSGSIAGDIASRSLGNYMPHMSGTGAGSARSGMKYTDTRITGGHISTTAQAPDGKTSNVGLYNAAQFNKPETPHSVVTASDGSQWYQIASGEGMGSFYKPPHFTGDAAEAAQATAAFPGAADGTMLRTLDDGMIEATHPDGSSLWLNSAHYQKPEAPHEVISDSNGVDWYAMHPRASVPDFETGRILSSEDGGNFGASFNGMSEGAMDYNRAQFQQFMPGYEQTVHQIDTSRHSDGMIEVRHSDGSGTAFYDRTVYQPPRGDYQVFEDNRGGQWYAIPGKATVEYKPVFEDGHPVYDGDNIRTVRDSGMKYGATLTRFGEPLKRGVDDRKPPTPKR